MRDPHELEAIKRSLRDEGFTAELIVCNRWNRKIVSGHGRVQACYDLGFRGKLPVVWREYSSEAEHRRAMLRWNRARGHQDLALMAREVEALLAEFEREEVARDMAMTDADIDETLSWLERYDMTTGTGMGLNTWNSPLFLKLVVAITDHAAIEAAIRAIMDKYGLGRGEAFVRICELVQNSQARPLDSPPEDRAPAGGARPI